MAENNRKNSLRTKISKGMITVVVCSLLVTGIFAVISMKRVSNTLLQANDEMSETSAHIVSNSMNKVAESSMLELVQDKSKLVDEIFQDFLQAVTTAADVAQKIYDNPSAYSGRNVPLPDKANDGKLAIQLLLAPGVNRNDAAVKKEIQLIGNIQDALLGINANLDSMASNYIATASGFMVQADYISASKFDADGNLMPLDARERPWYQGAAATGQPYFTPVTKDAHTTRLGIMCGVPVFRNGQVIAVSGAGMYLDGIDDIIQNTDLKSYGNSIIINQNNEVLFSTFSEGPLTPISEAGAGTTLNEALLALAVKAMSGETGIEQVEIDGAMNYVAYSKMATVGWAFMIIVPQETVESPTNQMVETFDSIRAEADAAARTRLVTTVGVLAALIYLAAMIASGISVILAKGISEPIQKLTEEVSKIEGDNLDFSWGLDTKDETQQLAASFQSLTERMKTHIEDIKKITADKERLDTELSLAKRIQTSMLPCIFPPYPDKTEFDIYALMNPAREIGGDFYDLFLIDDDHLGLVIADVSGKGIPAALFMMISKTILQSCAMLGKTPGEILTLTNEALCTNNETEMFITAWVGILELSTGKLTCANAGHEYPFIRTDDKFELIKDKRGFIIGGLPDMVYQEYEMKLKPGDTIFVYTDGVPEAQDPEQQMFGLERLENIINGPHDGSCRQIVDNVWAALEDYQKDAPQFDDVTMLCMKYLGPSGKKENS